MTRTDSLFLARAIRQARCAFWYSESERNIVRSGCFFLTSRLRGARVACMATWEKSVSKEGMAGGAVQITHPTRSGT